jgi:hypothetical protein
MLRWARIMGFYYAIILIMLIKGRGEDILFLILLLGRLFLMGKVYLY